MLVRSSAHGQRSIVSVFLGRLARQHFLKDLHRWSVEWERLGQWIDRILGSLEMVDSDQCFRVEAGLCNTVQLATPADQR